MSLNPTSDGSGSAMGTMSSCGIWLGRIASPPGGVRNSENLCRIIDRRLGSRRGLSNRNERVVTTFLLVMSEKADLNPAEIQYNSTVKTRNYDNLGDQ